MMKTTQLLAFLFATTLSLQASADERHHSLNTSVTITIGDAHGGYDHYPRHYVAPRRSHDRVIIHHAPARYWPFGVRHHDHRYDNDRYDRRDRHGDNRHHDNRRNDHRHDRGGRNHYR